MASEASSSNRTPDSFIGAHINIITKSENRYVGTVQNINTEEPTSIGVKNVRSYGTEGRKKDGQQIPSSDKVYEYILFSASDIKSVDVKESPTVQDAPAIHNDPAIIQSQESCPPSVSTSLPSSMDGLSADLSFQTAQMAVPRSTFQGGLPLYQPGGSLGSWGSSPLSDANVGGLGGPTYWQGFYGPSTGLSHTQQPSLLQPQTGLLMQHSMQPPMSSATSASILTGSSDLPALGVPAPNLPASYISVPKLPFPNLRELTPPLLPPFSIGPANLTSTIPQSTLPPQFTALASASSPSLFCNLTYSVVPSTASMSASLPLFSPLTSSSFDVNRTGVPASMPQMAPILSLPYQTNPISVSPILGTFKPSNSETSKQPVVTPGQLLQPGLTALSPSTSSGHTKEDVEVVQTSTSKPLFSAPVASSKPLLSAPVTTQAPVLPLPPQPNPKLNGPPFHTHYNHANRGRQRGRGNRSSHPVTRFTEEFDFTAMNEKFRKDEVWDDLGKVDKTESKEDDGKEDTGNVSEGNVEKSGYVKDDFFDSLSCDSLDNRKWYGRPKFSELMKRDSETFGDFPRHRGGRGGRWPGRGGRSRGSYYGRGHGRSRGRGQD